MVRISDVANTAGPEATARGHSCPQQPPTRSADFQSASRPCRRSKPAQSQTRKPCQLRCGQEGLMPPGFHIYPGGISHNSPTFQRWVGVWKGAQVPKGRPKPRGDSAVPSGLPLPFAVVPNVETLGYCRLSLRDKHQPPLSRDSRISNLAVSDKNFCAREKNLTCMDL